VLPISNYAEWLNFAFGPLYFLYVKRSLNLEKGRREWMHFIIAGFWLLYMTFYFIQSPEFKYNSYVDVKHPDWPMLDVGMIFDDNPLGIRRWTNLLTAIHFITYIVAAGVLFQRQLAASGKRFFRLDDETLKVIRNSLYHFSIIILIFLIVKLTFEGDIGDVFISSYISFMIYATSYQVLSQSGFFNRPHSFLEFPAAKYRKSTLSEDRKDAIMAGIREQMDAGYYKNNMASLAGLAGNIHETTHHVSQVINEKSGESFYELLARLRVEEAKRLLTEDTGHRITVEDLAERVGYNSKSSLNRTFKNLTGLTPTEFRNSI
jgi:AraC-like DNA-binding protein